LTTVESFPADVVVCDVGFPGMDGPEVAARLRLLPGMGGVPVIAVSGYSKEETDRRYPEATFDRHLVKPVDPNEVKALLAVLNR